MIYYVISVPNVILCVYLIDNVVLHPVCLYQPPEQHGDVVYSLPVLVCETVEFFDGVLDWSHFHVSNSFGL